jgi:Rrf2 family protein
MFNKETEYAIRGLVYIQIQNLNGLKPGIAEISKEIDAPYFYIAKILQRMVKNGFIASIKGKGGGFYFKNNEQELSLKDLITSTEGNEAFSGCGFGLKHCDENNPCPLHKQYSSIREEINQMVTGESVQSLAKKISSGKAILINNR